MRPLWTEMEEAEFIVEMADKFGVIVTGIVEMGGAIGFITPIDQSNVTVEALEGYSEACQAFSVKMALRREAREGKWN